MRYVALGDSISIDDYTGVAGGGAASQFARLVGATQFFNLTRDGCTTSGVLEAIPLITEIPDIVTLTVGGNDLLEFASSLNPSETTENFSAIACAAEATAINLHTIADHLASFRCTVIMNTIYDPTGGDDIAASHLGLPPALRTAFNSINSCISSIACEHGFRLSDLEVLFHGHGAGSPAEWFVLDIEPNYAGATAVANHWHALMRG